jgi:molybdopterin-guanine dinucleotide biosynthesis protein A
LPLDLATRLISALLEHKADIAVASSDDNTHPVFCLCKKSVLPSLTTFLAQGERRVSTWQKSQKYIEVDFSDCNEAFTNLNTVEDLAELELKLA